MPPSTCVEGVVAVEHHDDDHRHDHGPNHDDQASADHHDHEHDDDQHDGHDLVRRRERGRRREYR